MPNAAQLSDAIHTLTTILQHQKDRGNDRILLSEKNLGLLKNFPQQFRQQFAPQAVFAQNTEAVPQPRATPAAQPAPTSTSSTLAANKPANKNRRERLNSIARSVKTDGTCRALGTLGETMVFASGNPDAQLMLIGEAPGAEEEQQKKPLVGPAGDLLDKILTAMGLDRQEVYISNVVKFRPQPSGESNSPKDKRKPNSAEISTCLKYIMAEIDVVKPSVIIALGGTAANALLANDTAVKTLREQNHSIKGIPLIVTYHPSYLLHCESISPEKLKMEKGKVWTDMKSAMKKLATPSQS